MLGGLAGAVARGRGPARGGPRDVPAQVLGGAALRAFVGSAAPLTDAEPMRSPDPPDEIWRVGD